MKEKHIASLLVLAIALVLAAVGVAADPQGADVRVLNSTRGSHGGGTAGSVLTEAGNISEIEVNGSSITKSWQGFFGNITGNITLQDSSGHVMYDWSLGLASGEIYASHWDTISWAGTNPVNCSNHTLISETEVVWGMTANDKDNITATFRINVPHPTFYVGSFEIASDATCYATHTYVNSNGQNTAFPQVILNDENDRVIWAAILNDTTTGFDGKPHDFQMLVPENGKGAEADVRTSYYFWVELD